MKNVAKVLIKNPEGKYLILHRNHHPVFGDSIDLPGGTAEFGESIEATAIREVIEESGIDLSTTPLTHLVSSRNYSRMRNKYTLFEAELQTIPQVKISWEHLDFVWLSIDEIIKESSETNDMFLRMTADVLKSQGNA